MMTNLRQTVFCFALLLFLANAVHAQTPPRWRTLVNSPAASNGRHDDIFFVSNALGWAVNGNGNIFKTTDGGAFWMLLFTANVYFRSVAFVDSLRGWAGTLSSQRPLYETTDGGATWNVVQNIPAPLPSGICGFSIVGDSVVYGSGRVDGPARLIKTTDRGRTWQSFDLSSVAAFLVDCYFSSPDSGIVVGGTNLDLRQSRCIVLFTANGGTTWSVRHVGSRMNEWCWKISFPSRNVGYISLERLWDSGDTTQVYFLKTTNRGVTWAEKLFLTRHYDEEGIGFVTDSLGWIGGWATPSYPNAPTYETTDGGETWRVMDFGRNVNRFRRMNDTLAYAAGIRIYKYSRDSIAVSVQEKVIPESPEFSLHQNYPNPFNPSTTITFVLQRPSFVELQVFDIRGRLVETLVNHSVQTGMHAVDFSAKDHASGIYLVRLTVFDDVRNIRYTQSRKLVVVK